MAEAAKPRMMVEDFILKIESKGCEGGVGFGR
jgi:hypothetical protein